MPNEADPFEQLVARGAITRAQLDEAKRTGDDVVRTMASKLLAVGVDRAALYDALAKVSGMQLGEAPRLEFPPTFTLPANLEAIMRDALAGPLGQDADGTIDVLVADPRATKKLAAAGVKFRAKLGLETDVMDALDWLWPPSEDNPVPLALDGPPKDQRPRPKTNVPAEASPAGAARQTSRSVPRPAPSAGGGGLMKAAIVVVVLAGAGFGVFKLGLIGGGPKGPSPAVLKEQAKKLEDARLLARKGEHAWAYTQCQEAVALAPTSGTGKEAAIFCAEQNFQLGEKNKGLDSLTALKKALAPDDPLHGEIDALLKKHGS